jgi:hypothetical protein
MVLLYDRMAIDLSRWSAVEIAAAATCLAATVAAVGSFVVAAVNAWSARRLARETARREFRLTVARPYLEFVDRLIGLHREVLFLPSATVASLRKAASLLSSSDQDKGKEEIRAASLRLDEMISRLSEMQEVHRSTGLFAFVLSDQRVLDAYMDWLDKHQAVLEVFVAGKFNASPEQLRKVDQAASKAFNGAVKLRITVEGFIFGNHGWLSRGCYFIWSKARRAVRKVLRRPPPGPGAASLERWTR